MPIVAMIGVWKAGAAWALVEDTYAPERINYIREDCGCRVELCADNWEDIMNTEPLIGHEEADEHDAAYAIYTSGTTGNPKGVLHEYDKNLAVKCSNGTFVGKGNGSVLSFRGVPYAKQPIGELRWKRPEPPENSKDVFEAYYNGKTPIQIELTANARRFILRARTACI